MRTLFVILPGNEIYKKRFARPARPDEEFIRISANSPAHRFVRNIQMNRFARQPIDYLDAERAGRIPVIGFFSKKTQGLLGERKKTFLARTVPGISGYRASKQGRYIDRIVTRFALHERKLTPYLVFYLPQFVPVIRPCHHVEMTPNRSKTETMRLVQIGIQPLFIYLIRAAVFR